MAVSKTLRYQVFRRDNHTCYYCGRSAPEVKLTIDHVVPEALGGRDVPENLRTACTDCNGGKSATPPDAAQVAQVAADADRWAAAQAVVGQRLVEQLQARNAAYDEFDEAWRAWGEVPKPSNWKGSIDSFVNAGLPKEILLDCLEKAMSNQRIEAGSVFRYMCGIAWSRINEMRDQVETEARSKAAAEPVENLPEDSIVLTRLELRRTEVEHLREGMLLLSQTLLSHLEPEDQERFREAALAHARETGRVIFEDDVDIPILTAEYAFPIIVDRLDACWQVLGELLNVIPDRMLTRAIAKARHDGVPERELVLAAAAYAVDELRAATITEGDGDK